MWTSPLFAYRVSGSINRLIRLRLGQIGRERSSAAEVGCLYRLRSLDMARMASACGQPSKTELGAVWFRRPMLNQRNALLASRLSTLPTTATARAPRQDAPRSVNSRRRNGARVRQGYHVFERLLPGLGLTGCVGSRKAHACRLTPGIG